MTHYFKHLIFILSINFCTLAIVAQDHVWVNDNIALLEMNALKKKAEFIPIGNTANYDIVYHRLHWSINPQIYYLNGHVTSYIKTLTDNVDTIVFNLAEPLLVDSILKNGEKLSYEHSNELIKIKWPYTLSSGQLDSVSIYYQGEPNTRDGMGAFMMSQHGEDNAPVISTVSEPYGAKDWWPCKQTLTDKIDSIDVYIEAPEQYKAASNGVLVNETISNGKKITHWKHRHPITTYLVAMSVTNYIEFTDYATLTDGTTIPILSYVFPEYDDNSGDDESYRDNIAFTADVIELFSELFIAYPFKDEKYGHAQMDHSGSLEQQTMSFMGKFSKKILTHELAHQWFGNHVTCASWRDIWVNEGFATYCEAIAMEKLDFNDAFAWKKENMDRVILRCKEGTVYVEDTSSFSSLFNYNTSYIKPAMVLNMLRHQIGDTAFFLGLKNILTHESSSQKFADTEHVKYCFEQAANKNLESFFNNWIYKEGYPIFSFDWAQNAENNKTHVTIKQFRTNLMGKAFELRVPIYFYGEGQQKKIEIDYENNFNKYYFDLGFVVDSVVFDPELHIIAPHPAEFTKTDFVEEENSVPDNLSTINIYPNPFTDNITVSCTENSIINKIEVLNTDGHLVISSNQTKKLNTRINLNSLESGVYFIRVYTNKGSFTKKIIKSH